MKKFSFYQMALTIMFILITLTMIVPLLNILAISLSDPSVSRTMGGLEIIPKKLNLINYKVVLSHPVLLPSVFNSVFITVVGTLFDIFIRPSRKALDLVHEHIQLEYQISTDAHIVHPFLHENLEQKQQNSAFWRNPIVAWLWLHIPDILGLIVLVLMALAVWFGLSAIWHWWQGINP